MRLTDTEMAGVLALLFKRLGRPRIKIPDTSFIYMSGRPWLDQEYTMDVSKTLRDLHDLRLLSFESGIVIVPIQLYENTRIVQQHAIEEAIGDVLLAYKEQPCRYTVSVGVAQELNTSRRKNEST